jgi:hypothetical protein
MALTSALPCETKLGEYIFSRSKRRLVVQQAVINGRRGTRGTQCAVRSAHCSAHSAGVIAGLTASTDSQQASAHPSEVR